MQGGIAMFCHRCGQQLPPDALFCNSCGTKLQVTGQHLPNPSPGRITIQFENDQQAQQAPQNPYEGRAASSPNLPVTNTPFTTGQIGTGPFVSPNQSGEHYLQMPQPQRSIDQNTPSAPLHSISNSGTQYPPVWQVPPVQPTPSNQQSGDFGTQYPPVLQTPSMPPTQQVRNADTRYPPTWQTPSIPLNQQAGTSTLPQQPLTPSTGMQRLLVRIFGPTISAHPVFGILLGSVVAAAAGLLVSAIFLSIAHAIAPHVPPSSSGMTGEDVVDYALGIIPLHNLYRDSLQFFPIMHGTAIHTQYTNNAQGYYYASMSYFSLYGLLIVPALLLTLGGFIAASTDFHNRISHSLWRGVGIAIPYTVFLFIMASQASGCIPNNGTDYSALLCQSGSNGPVSLLSVDNTTLLIFGLLWGSIFGLLGASLAIARGQWRRMIFYYLRSTSRPQILGVIVGGLTSVGIGILLALLVLFSFMAYSSYSLPFLTSHVCLVTGDWQSLVLWAISQGPLYAVNVLFLSTGAPINFNNPQQASCFYTGAVHTSISLFGTTPMLSSWTRLLLALPIISLFFGGRVSAAIGRANSIGAGAIQGGLMTLPFSLLMLLLSVLCTITNAYSFSNSTGTTAPASYVATAGVSAFDLFLWTLLGGAVVGAIGGMYQLSSVKLVGSTLRQVLAVPLVTLGKPFFFILDKWSRQPISVHRSTSRTLLYGAFLCAMFLLIIAGVAGANLIALNQILTFDQNIRIRDILSVILIALPGLLLIGAIGAALATDPSSPQRQMAQPGSVPIQLPSTYLP
jgi:zinc ribbon protein